MALSDQNHCNGWQVYAIYIKSNFECDWLTLRTVKAHIMKGCADLLNQIVRVLI